MSDELTLELSSSEEELGLGLGLGGGMLGGLPTWREARMRESSPSPEKRLRLWNASTSRRDLLPWPRAFSPSRRARPAPLLSPALTSNLGVSLVAYISVSVSLAVSFGCAARPGRYIPLRVQATCGWAYV